MSSLPFTYGSDQSGLVWAYQFAPERAALPLQSAEVADLFGKPPALEKDEFLWLHFNLSQSSTEKWLRDHARLPPEFFEALHQGSRSTRIELTDESLIAVVNDVLHGFSFDPSELSTMWVSVTPQLVISARKKPLKSVDRLRHSVQQGARIQSPTELLIHLLRDQADVLIGIVRDAVEKV